MTDGSGKRVAWKVTDDGFCIDIDGDHQVLVAVDDFPDLVLLLLSALKEQVVRDARLS